MHVVVRHPSGHDERTRSAASQLALQHGLGDVPRARVVASYAKRELPNYQVFDERRYFKPGTTAMCVFEVDGVRVGLVDL
jgi:NAD+ synthase (glutamine-hydrolysing)